MSAFTYSKLHSKERADSKMAAVQDARNKNNGLDEEEGKNLMQGDEDIELAKVPNSGVIGKGSLQEQAAPLAVKTEAAAAGGAEKPKDTLLVIGGCMMLNFWSAVGIIWTNKYIMNHGFVWTSTLTVMHFAFSFLGLELCWRQFSFFQPKKVSYAAVTPLCLSFIAFVVFNNLSLQFNTVGIYQLLKVLMTPVIVVLQFSLYRITLPKIQIASLMPICMGVGLATVSSLEVNGMKGLMYGCLGILSTSLYQIWVKTEQTNLDLNPQQLLHNQAFLATFLLFFIALVVDYDFYLCSTAYLVSSPPSIGLSPRDGSLIAGSSPSQGGATPLVTPDLFRSFGLDIEGETCQESKLADLLAYKKGLGAAGGLYMNPSGDSMTASFIGVFISSILAFLVNLSTFLVIGKTSPVSYQVLGHSKLVVIMLSSFLMFGDVPNPQNLAGVSLALGGIFWYTWLKMQK